ncbi:MAG: nickel-dependent lactate racemase [Peptococcaceae bacterium]
MKIKIPYGKSEISLDVPEQNLVGVLRRKKELKAAADPDAEIKRALANPIGTLQLSELAAGKKTAAILIVDRSRPVPIEPVAKNVIEELNNCGISDDNITIIAATGMHNAATREEGIELLGPDIMERIKFISNDPDNPDAYYHLGATQQGTPVEVLKVYCDAELKISISAIDPHHQAGWSGGAKNVLPGISSRQSVYVHHRLFRHPTSQLGRLDGNRFREELEEAASKPGLDFIVNCVHTEGREIAEVFAGHYVKAHREGAKFFAEYVTHKIKPVDILIANPGGYPRDREFYQTEGKGFTRVSPAVKQGGIVIMVAECSLGMGEPRWAEAMKCTKAEMVEAFKDLDNTFSTPFMKAWRLNRVMEQADIFVVSKGISSEDMPHLPIRFFTEVQEAIATAIAEKGEGAEVLVVPDLCGVILEN